MRSESDSVAILSGVLRDFSRNSEWMEDANCKNMDVNLFFPKLGATIDPFVKEVCEACPVSEQCLWYANESSSDHGFFGGMAPRDRMLWRKKNKVVLGMSKTEWEAA